jgi:plastocyanin
MLMTTNSSRLLTVLVGALALVACDNNGNNDVQENDATTDTGGTTDTGTTTDTGIVEDTGTETDTGTVADTGTTGTPLNGCETFVAASAIAFAGTSYTPNCVQIAAGGMVTFTGDFTMHPLRPGRAPSRPATDNPSAEPNPITNTDTGATMSFTFPTAGDYGFYCNVHQSLGMYGVVRVQ